MFLFYSPSRIIWGRDSFKSAPLIISGHARRVFIICQSFLRSSPFVKEFTAELDTLGVFCKLHFLPQGSEPDIVSVDAAASLASDTGADCVVGIGGGTAMDTAKAVSALAVCGGSVKDYLEGVGTGKKVDRQPLIFFAVPTTAGTGAEVTKNAVISGPGYKRSFRDDRLYAHTVFIDPLLHTATPKDITAQSGMDALTQGIEAYISVKSTSFSRAMAIASIKHCGALRSAYDNGMDINARMDMALGAAMSGIALASGGLGAVHGIAAGLGAVLKLSHGLCCAALLPHVLRVNIDACKQQYREILSGLTGRDVSECRAEELIAYIENLNRHMGIPEKLSGYGLDGDSAVQSAQSCSPSSMQGNPIALSGSRVLELVHKLI